jgi:hypothetical protein
MTARLLKRASTSRRSGEWNDDDFDVLCDGAVVGPNFSRRTHRPSRVVDVDAGLGHHKDRTQTHGYAATGEAAMAAFAKSWRRE